MNTIKKDRQKQEYTELLEIKLDKELSIFKGVRPEIEAILEIAFEDCEYQERLEWSLDSLRCIDYQGCKSYEELKQKVFNFINYIRFCIRQGDKPDKHGVFSLISNKTKDSALYLSNLTLGLSVWNLQQNIKCNGVSKDFMAGFVNAMKPIISN